MTDAAAPPPRPTSAIDLAVNYGPLVAFFLANKWGGMFVATGVFMAATVIAGIAAWLKDRHLPPMLLFSGLIVLVFGGLTLWLNDPVFIQLKPTIIYAVFIAILGFGLVTGRPTLQIVMGSLLPGIDADGWRKLTRNWLIFFAGLLAANEVARRLLDFDAWLTFKVWGVLIATVAFNAAQVPLMKRHGLRLD